MRLLYSYGCELISRRFAPIEALFVAVVSVLAAQRICRAFGLSQIAVEI